MEGVITSHGGGFSDYLNLVASHRFSRFVRILCFPSPFNVRSRNEPDTSTNVRRLLWQSHEAEPDGEKYARLGVTSEDGKPHIDRLIEACVDFT